MDYLRGAFRCGTVIPLEGETGFFKRFRFAWDLARPAFLAAFLAAFFHRAFALAFV